MNFISLIISLFAILPLVSCGKPADTRIGTTKRQLMTSSITNTDSLFFYDSLLPILEETSSEGLDICYILDFFLGKPYVANTLEGNTEQLVVNFHELDCFTYWETASALYIQSKNNTHKLDLDTYKMILASLRYQNSKAEGYASRNHYTSEWIINNTNKGFVTELTKSIGGKRLDKNINFMSENSDKYSALVGNPEGLQKIRSKEEQLKNTECYYIPKEDVNTLTNKQVHNGDLLALVTSIKGLDVTHVGFARWVNGTLHLQHASSRNMKVEISDESLSDYLMSSKRLIGIRLVRISTPTHSIY